jgi:hypothetical protein
MAGNYPDQPSWRMAIDRDGTQLLYVASDNTISQGTSAELRTLNDETPGGVNSSDNGYTVFMFPEARDIDGLYINWTQGQFGPSPNSVQVSTNTTNGFDGTWTSLGTVGIVNVGGVVKPGYRTGIASTTVLAVRALRLKWNASAYGSGYPSFL